MALTHPTAQRSAFALSVLSTIDDGTGNGQCVLKVSTTASSTITLNKPSFTEASGVLTLDASGPPEDSSATGNAGSVDNFSFQRSDGTVAFNGVVPGDMTLSKNPIDPGDTVQLTSYTYTASP
jgi:hypothetical protein